MGNDRVAEYSATLSSQNTYQSFVHISEDVYYKFVNTISTSKGINDTNPEKYKAGMVKLVYLNKKKDEYFNAFKKLREFLLESGTSSKEIEAMMRIRTYKTKELMGEIYNFVKINNVHDTTNKINLINFNKLIFNIINYISNINAVNYVPPTDEELKENHNRKTKDEYLQRIITDIESGMVVALRLATRHHHGILDILTASTNMTEVEIHKALKEYNAEYLIKMLTK